MSVDFLPNSSAPVTRIDLATGLTEFPREVFDHADTLEILNLTGNQLTSLPEDLGRLSKLKILFCSNNRFSHLPAVLGTLPSLTMIGFRANQIESIDLDAFPPHLRWLILTENRLRSLPATLGRCRALQKLMLSGNSLSSLPEEMAACEHLELLRLAANQFEVLPDWLLCLPRLAWLALAGNPCMQSGSSALDKVKTVPWGELTLQKKLGEGASGVISQARWSACDNDVAVKVFKNAITSDGLPLCELEASLGVGEHPNLTRVLGPVSGHPDGASGMVMELIDPSFTSLAGPPSFDTCTRDVYPAGQLFALEETLAIVRGIASAMAQMHVHGILHGDLYAHNILVAGGGRSLLSDFGAAAFYDLQAGPASHLERLDVRAFGILMEELLERTCVLHADTGVSQALSGVTRDCLNADVSQRPNFQELVSHLLRLES